MVSDGLIVYYRKRVLIWILHSGRADYNHNIGDLVEASVHCSNYHVWSWL